VIEIERKKKKELRNVIS